MRNQNDDNDEYNIMLQEQEQLQQNQHHLQEEVVVEDTSNDESIARALAAMDGPTAVPVPSSSMNSGTLPATEASDGGMFTYPGQRRHWEARRWNSGRSNNNSSATSSTRGVAAPPGNSNFYPVPPQRPPTVPPSSLFTKRNHLCFVPCLVGHAQVCVEMMIDTGAESSVMSYDLVKQLGLQDAIDRRWQGIASGVGQARILGKIQRVPCSMMGGHAEFFMEFVVLDMPNSKLLLLGMDQLRHYNCVIDLKQNVLIFGGTGGIEVPMLPPEESSMAFSASGQPELCTIS